MRLTDLEIANFRSIEHAKLIDFGQMNVLIGRNNAGKSSIFNAVQMVASEVRGGAGCDWNRHAPQGDIRRLFDMHLSFDLNDRERSDYISLIGDGAGLDAGRRDTLFTSPLGRKLNCRFTVPFPSDRLMLAEVFLQDEDACLAKIHSNDAVTTGLQQSLSKVSMFVETVRQNPGIRFERSVLDLDYGARTTNMNIALSALPSLAPSSPALTWPLLQIGRFLANSFFLSPLRHGEPSLNVHETNALHPAGANLPQILHTLSSNSRPTFDSVSRFVSDIVPDIGRLVSPILGNATEVRFESDASHFVTRLYEMGGGIEQLLMMAVILLTTDESHPIFMEEPETHLHAGAQRLLGERLRADKRQVFVTTHSSVFLNLSPLPSIHMVTLVEGRAIVIAVPEAKGLAAVLTDIDVRLSDVLLSYAVLFVEGPGDRDALNAWSRTLGQSLEARNVAVLPMGGGSTGPARSKVLEDIAEQVHIPFLILLDRDERSQREVTKLQKLIKNNLHILEARELENYLLVPRVILERLQERGANTSGATEGWIDSLIDEATETLYNQVLLKRIRTELGSLDGGFIHEDSISSLESYAAEPNLHTHILDEFNSRLRQKLQESDIETIVAGQREKLDNEWTDKSQRRRIAPGEEILDGVFKKFALRYDKPSTTATLILR